MNFALAEKDVVFDIRYFGVYIHKALTHVRRLHNFQFSSLEEREIQYWFLLSWHQNLQFIYTS